MFKLKSKLIIAVMVVFGITSFMSCENAELLESSKTPSEITTAEITKMHNEVINRLNSSLKSGTNYSFEDNGVKYFQDVIPEIKAILNEIDGSRYKSDIDAEAFVQLMSKHNLRQSGEIIGFADFVEISVSDLLEKQFITEYFYAQLIELGKKAETLSSSELLDYLDNEFAAEISESESFKKELIIEMAHSSNELWNTSQGRIKADGNSVIIADAIGALVGFGFGGVGSIIFGAAYSLLDNNIREYR